MKKNDLENLFNKLHGTFDIKEPLAHHEQRFLEKLEAQKANEFLVKRNNTWWKPLAIAATVLILCSAGISLYYTSSPTIDEKIAEIAPEVSKTEFYFASLIETQVKQLESENSPETEKIVEDTMMQLKKLETDYTELGQDLLNGGNSKLILSAMITNFQTRIDLLKDVLEQIETIKNFKKHTHENTTI